jgi:peptide/nickel transport system substrate-binding protein
MNLAKPTTSIISRVLALGAAVAVATSLVACSESGPSTPTKDTLTIATGSFIVDIPLDPFDEFGQVNQLLPPQAVYESLIVFDETTNTLQPWLASEFTLSDDRRTLDMTLREDVDYSDGTHFDAEAVKAYWDAVMAENPTFGPDGSYGTELSVTGEYGLEITTSRTSIDNDFMRAVWTTPMVSPSALEDHEALNDNPVGTGPYLFEERVPGVSVTFTANPDYWNADAVPFTTVTFLAFDDPVASFNALKSGQIDATSLDASYAAEAAAAGFRVHEGGGTFAGLAILDTAGDIVPALGDLRVRRAISMVFDREAIRDNINHGYGAITDQIASDIFPWYVPSGDDRYPYDPDEAKALMAEAGYADGFAITIPVLASHASYQPIVEQSLSELNIAVTFESTVDYPAWDEAALSGDFPVLLMSEFFINLPGYARHAYYQPMVDDEADRILTQVETGTIDEVGEAYAALGEHVLDEAWFAIFGATTSLWATAPEIDMIVGDVIAHPQLVNFTLAED